jgi:protein HIRA/HIR1
VLRRLIGHDNDVQDLGWSYDSSILVSVGLDSKVVVWSGHTFEKLKTIAHHQSHVKGVTFDPANKYFATSSDDRTIKVYRFTSPPPNANAQDQANNFILETTISKAFETSPLTTYFRRCSWSPEGAHIAAANSTNGPVSSVAVITRGAWDSEQNQIHLIGHEGPVEVCAFSPRMFYSEPPGPSNMDANGNSTQGSVTIVACAGQDKTLTVWNTRYARPFVVTHELAMKSLTDLAWMPSGETLFITSLDGSIMALLFEQGELGYPASFTENEKTLSKYGAGRRVGIVEGTDALLLEESSKAGELKGVQGRMGALMGDGGAASLAPVTNGVNGTSSTQTNGSVVGQPAAPVAPTEPPPDQRVEKLKQRVTVTKDGRKRIAPMLVSSSFGVGESSLPQTRLMSATTSGAGRADNPHNVLDLSKPYDGYSKGGLASMLIGNKRKHAEIEDDEDRRVERRLADAAKNGGAAIVLNSENGLIPPAAAGPKTNDTESLKVLRPAIISPALSVSQIRLAIPKVRSVIVRTMDGSEPPQTNGAESKDNDAVLLEARNATGPSRTGRVQDHDPVRITCTKKGQILWQDFLPRAVLLLTGNPNFFSAACEDGSVYTWTPAGRRSTNALIMDAQPVIMDCRGWFLMCISSVGIASIWNLETLSALHPPVSLGPVLDIAAHTQGPHLTRSPGIVFARLNSAGRMILAMSNGDGYMYNTSMYAWQRISEPWWAVGSQYWNTADSSLSNIKPSSAKEAPKETNDQVSIENLSAGIIPTLERNTTNQFLLQGRAFYLQRLIKALISAEGYESFESCVSVAHLENRVSAALALGAREEFKIYLTMYAKRIGAEGLKGKIEELLQSLAGDFLTEDDEAENSKKPDSICGWKKEELLKELVLIFGMSPSSLPLCSLYDAQLLIIPR